MPKDGTVSLRCPVVAVYLGSPYPNLKFTLLSLLKEDGRLPLAMQFVPRQPDATAVNAGNATLVVVWKKERTGDTDDTDADIAIDADTDEVTFVRHPILHTR